MTEYLPGAVALMIGGLGPAAWLAARGDPIRRLLGLELAGVVAVPLMLLLSFGSGQSSYLVVPVVLAVLSFAGTLVFIRLLEPRPRADGGQQARSRAAP